MLRDTVGIIRSPCQCGLEAVIKWNAKRIEDIMASPAASRQITFHR
jgi:hypothetical protein